MDQLSPQDQDLMTRTVLSEAGQDGAPGMTAVASVIRNRVASGQYGSDPSDVVLAPNQFSSWSLPGNSPDSPSRWKPQSPQYQQASQIVNSVWSGKTPDPTGGADHYLNPTIVQAQRGSLPGWAQGQPTAQIGGHSFYASPQAAPSMIAMPSSSDIAATKASLGIPQWQAVPSSGPGPTVMMPTGGSPTGSPSPTVPPVPATGYSANVTPDDIAATAKMLGVGTNAPAATPAAATAPAPPAIPGPVAAQAATMAPAMGFGSSMVEGMPIVGPLFDKALAATGAAIQPLVGANAPATFGERYTQNLAAQDLAQKTYNAANPVTSTLGNVVGAGTLLGPLGETTLGAAALGLPNATRLGATLGGRLYTGMAGGAGIGASDAALRGNNPVAGAEVGGAAGALGPLIAHGVGNVISAGANAFRGGAGLLSNVNPIARNWLSTAMANETPASIAAARQRMGPTGFLSDINAPMTELAAGISNRAEAPGSGIISEAYRQRDAAQGDAIERALNRNVSNPVDIEDFKNAITENQKAAATPLYQQFRTMQVHPTPEIQALVPRLDAAGAFDQAEKLAGISGDTVNRNFFVGGPQKAFPTTQSWDYIKRSLDSKIDQAYSGGDNTTARALINLKNDVITAVGKTSAGQVWNQARQEFADRASLLDQIDAGSDTFLGGRSGQTVAQMRQEMLTLNGPERAARVVGLRNAAEQVMGATRNGDTTLRNKFLAPNNQEKLRLLLGNDRAKNLIDTMQQQDYLSGQAKYVNPRAGSPTAPRTAAMNALEPPPQSEWNPNIAQPLSFIPPAWIDALRPSTILQGGRNSTYAGARQQLAPLLTQPAGPKLDDLIKAIGQEQVGRAAASARGANAARLIGSLIAGPGAQTARLRGNFSTMPALAGPLR